MPQRRGPEGPARTSRRRPARNRGWSLPVCSTWFRRSRSSSRRILQDGVDRDHLGVHPVREGPVRVVDVGDTPTHPRRVVRARLPEHPAMPPVMYSQPWSQTFRSQRSSPRSRRGLAQGNPVTARYSSAGRGRHADPDREDGRRSGLGEAVPDAGCGDHGRPRNSKWTNINFVPNLMIEYLLFVFNYTRMS